MRFLRFLHGCDSYQRHKIVADAILNSQCDSQTILDVGGETKATTNKLAYFLPNKKVLTVNVIEKTGIQVEDVILPFADNSIDAVVSIDTIEHIPKEKRKRAFAEYYRVASKEVVVTGPIDNEYQRQSEIRLNEKYKSLFGTDHHFLIEHISYGDPSIEELIELIGDKTHSIVYIGDNTVIEKHIEKSFSFCPQIKPINKLYKLLYTIYTIKDYKPSKYLQIPEPTTRRFLAHILL